MVQELDGTQNQWGWCKQKFGANAILAVSLAVCKAGAYVKKISGSELIKLYESFIKDYPIVSIVQFVYY
jgi:enolase